MRGIRFLVVSAAMVAWAHGWPSSGAETHKPARLLVVTVTKGFRHASIGTAEPALEELGRSTGLFHCDHLRMPTARSPQPKPPKRAKDTSDEEWKRQEADFKQAQEKFRRDDEAGVLAA